MDDPSTQQSGDSECVPPQAEEPVSEQAPQPSTEPPPSHLPKEDSQQASANRPFYALNCEDFRDFYATTYLVTERTEEKKEGRPQEARLIAVSQPLPNERQFSYDDEELNAWTSQLRKSRLLVMISPDSASLFSAAQEAALKLVDYYKPFVLNPDSGSPSGAPIYVNPCLPAMDGDPAAVFVADGKSSTSLLDSAMKINLIRENLRVSNWLILLLANNEILGWSEDPARMQAEQVHIPCVRVPFLAPRLRREFPSDWDELQKEICRQREAGRWKADDEGFYSEVMSYLGRGLLRQEIEKRRQSRDVGGALPQDQKVQADRLLSPGTPLENSVLFLATFFPNLQMRDFECLLLSVLGDRTQVARTAAYVLTPDGEGHVEEVGHSRLLRDVWSENYPEILQKCHLQIRNLVEVRANGPSSIAVVDFSAPELRDDLREAFTGFHAPIFFAHLHLVKRTQLLFDKDLEIANAAVRLMVDTALSFPGEFAGSSLGGVVLLDTLSMEKKITLPRLHLFLRAFLRRPSLRELVNQFMHELFSLRRYDDLIKVVWSLRDVSQFDPVFWFKRLFDEGDESARRKALLKLHWGMRSGGGVELFQCLFRWLPQPGVRTVAISAAVSQSFFIELSEELLFDRRRPRLRNPLLVAAGGDSGDSLMKCAVSWLFHPAVAPVLKQRTAMHFGCWVNLWLIPSSLEAHVYDGDEGRFLERLARCWAKVGDDPVMRVMRDPESVLFPALVIADWAIELLSDDRYPDLARSVFNRLLGALGEQCNATKRSALGVHWAAMEQSLLDLTVLLERLNPRLLDLDRQGVADIRRDFQTRRRCLKQLRIDLQACGRTPTH